MEDATSANQNQRDVNISESESLATYFKQEILKNVDLLAQYVDNSEDENINQIKLEGMTQACHDIEDLAMVHGYCDIEALALQIFSLIRNIKKSDPDDRADSLVRIQSALKTMRRALDNLEQTCDVPESRQTSETSSGSPADDNIPEYETESSDLEIELRELEKSDSDLFDIKELDNLFSMLPDAQADGTNEIDADNSIPDISLPPNEYSVSPLAAPADHDDDLRETVRTACESSLNSLEIAIRAIRDDDKSGKAIVKVQEYSHSLHHRFKAFDDERLVEIAGLLDTFCQENLSVDALPGDDLIQLLIKVVDTINSYLSNPSEHDGQVRRLSNRIKMILKAQQQLTKLDEFNQSKGYSQPAGQIFSDPVKPAKPKKKIKIIPSKEDIRRRWILKF